MQLASATHIGVQWQLVAQSQFAGAVNLYDALICERSHAMPYDLMRCPFSLKVHVGQAASCRPAAIAQTRTSVVTKRPTDLSGVGLKRSKKERVEPAGSAVQRAI
jgi:hypothetical protein